MPDLFCGVLILSDLDNTFLGRCSRVVPENIDAIEYFKSRGGRFSFATGRDPFALDVVLPDSGKIANFPSIVANGAYLCDLATRECFSPRPLNKKLFLPVLRAVLDRFPTVGIRISTKDCFLCPNVTTEMSSALSGYDHVTRAVDFDSLPEETFYKCVFHADAETLSRVRAFVTPLTERDFAISASSVTLFEILDRRATKGKMVFELRKFGGFPLTVYGAGDWENDIELLQASDFACSPENAMDRVKELSQIHLCHHDRGAIADLIAKIEQSRR